MLTSLRVGKEFDKVDVICFILKSNFHTCKFESNPGSPHTLMASCYGILLESHYEVGIWRGTQSKLTHALVYGAITDKFATGEPTTPSKSTYIRIRMPGDSQDASMEYATAQQVSEAEET